MKFSLDEIIYSKDQLIAYMEACAKPKEDWKVGFEYEIFSYNSESKKPLNYQGAPGITDIFKALQDMGWVARYENEYITKLSSGLSTISLEPGGQLELASAPHVNIHQVFSELTLYVDQLKKTGNDLGISYLTLGYHPDWTIDEIPKMPNPDNRYKIIAHYLNKVGRYGVDIMYRTCSAQASLDYGSEADMVKKFRVSLALQPVLAAIFSNSPFVHGIPTNSLSARSHAWLNANRERTDMSSLVFEEGFCFERYVDYILDLPVYLIFRNGIYIDAQGQPFREFLRGSLAVLPGELPTLGDWQNHIGTVWPEVRLKNVLEIRGADSGPVSQVCALTALITGLLYEESCLETAWDIAKTWCNQTRDNLYRRVIREGLGAVIGKNCKVIDIAKEVLDIANAGLKARNYNNWDNQSESIYLDSVSEIVASGKTPADALIESYYGKWQNKVDILDLSPF